MSAYMGDRKREVGWRLESVRNVQQSAVWCESLALLCPQYRHVSGMQ